MTFTALSELQGNGIVDISLPRFVPEEQIGLEMTRIDRLARLGGFACVKEITSYEGRSTQTNVNIVGHDGAGSAYAGGSAVKKASLSETEAEDQSDNVIDKFFVHNKPGLSIKINMSEVTQNIQQTGQRLREPLPWSQQINKAIGQGLRQASWDHYVKQPNHHEAVAAIAYFAFISNFNTILDATQNNYNRIAGLLLGLAASPAMLGIWKSTGAGRVEVCHSLFPVIHPDRALLVNGLTRVLKLSKEIN